MNPQTLDAAMNLILLIVLLGAGAFMVYRWTRPKKPTEKEVQKRPEGYRPRARQEESEDDEEIAPHSPITDFWEMPTRSPMEPPKPPTFRSVVQKKASTGVHSPYPRKDVD